MSAIRWSVVALVLFVVPAAEARQAAAPAAQVTAAKREADTVDVEAKTRS